MNQIKDFYAVDDREWFVPGMAPDGSDLSFDEYEQLRSDLMSSDAGTEEEIRAFIAAWFNANLPTRETVQR